MQNIFCSAGNAENDGEVTQDGKVIQKVKKCLHLEDVLISRGGVQEAVNARLRSKWKKFKDMASVQVYCAR